MALIKSGASSDELTIDPTSKAARTTLYDAAGNPLLFPRQLLTYSSVSAAFTPAATPDDVFEIAGNASNSVKVYRMGIATTQTTSGVNAWHLAKRSAANTGGTPVGGAEVPHDAADAAAQSAVRWWTANPTVGALVGNVWGGWVNSPLVTEAGIGGLVGVEVDFVEGHQVQVCIPQHARDVPKPGYAGSPVSAL